MEREFIEESLREQNPWWISKEKIYEDEKIKEALEKKKKIEYKFEKENQIIFGPRQVGKTTYLKMYIKNLIENKERPRKIAYFSCEPLRNERDLIELFRIIDEKEIKYILLDEVSFVENWQKGIKYFLDSSLKKGKKIIMTGSSSINLKKERFPGRKIKKRVFYPLNFKSFAKLFGSEELKNAIKKKKAEDLMLLKKEIKKLFQKFILSGGFPKAFYQLMEEGKISEETYQIYWEWLIGDIAKIERSEKITKGVLEGVIKNYGNKFSLNSIAKELEIGSHVTVREYLEILEDLFFIRNFYTFDISKKKVVYRKMRKAYFIDPFLYHVTKRAVLGTKEFKEENIIEGIIAEELSRKFGEVGFFHSKKEIDFCFEDKGIELKWQNKITTKDFPKVNIKKKIILSKEEYRVEKDILIIPAYIFLLLI